MNRVAAMLTAVLLAGTPTVSAQACGTTGMALQILGSGGPRLSRERASTSYLVWLDGRGRVLVDAGGGSFLRFGQAGGRLEDLSVLAISHLHPDHVSDLPALLWLSHLARKEPLPITGPSGSDVAPEFQTFLRRLFDARSGAFPLLGSTLGDTLRAARLGVSLDVTTVRVVIGDPVVVFDRQGIRLTALGVPHGAVPTIAYKVEAGGATIVFGSDQTGTYSKFIDFARAADILVMHLTIGAGESSPLHAAPWVVGHVARDANARRLVLSHIGQFDLDAAVADVKRYYAGPVTVGADLQCTSAR